MKCAFDKGAGCAALSEKQCDGCSFYKTQAQITEGRKRAEERIASLPEEQREHIKLKYKQLCRYVCAHGEEGEP